MAAENIGNRINAAPNSKRAVFYLRFLVAIASFIIIAIWLDDLIRGQRGVADEIIEFARAKRGIGVLLAGGSIYILLLSLPFVPGVELGILLMCAFGKEGIVFVYVATVAGLMTAFLMGRMLPKKRVAALFKKLGVPQPDGNPSDAIIFFPGNLFLDKKWNRTLFSNSRYLIIAVLFNMPGTHLIGGGGGIAFACGISRNISFKLFLPTVVFAVAPVPLLAFLGAIQLESFLH